MNEKRTQLLEGGTVSLMIKLSLPAIIGQAIVGLYPLVDMIFIGQMVGVVSMSAVSITAPFVLINNGIAVLIGMGSASVLSRAIGAKNQDKVDKIMGNLILSVLILSALVMVLGTIFAPQLLRLGGAEGELLEIGTRYLRIIYIGSFFVNFMQSANMIIRAEGRMVVAMVIMGAGALLNIILDPIFIHMMGERGAEGAAMATVIAQFVQAVATFIYFKKFSPVVKFKRIGIFKNIFGEMMGVGLSGAMMQIMFLVQMAVIYSTIAKMGTYADIALMGAAQRVMQFSFVPIWGMSQGFQPAVGTNYGAKQYDRVKKFTKVFILGGTVLAGFFFLIIQLFPGQILSSFITDPEIVEGGIADFSLMFSVFFSYGLLIMIMTYLQALGKALPAIIITVLRQVLLIVPLVKILPLFMGTKGIWAAIPLNDVIVLVIGIVILIVQFKKLDRE